MRLLIPLLFAILYTPALGADNPFAPIFDQHKRLVRELSKHLLSSELGTSQPVPLPNQKNKGHRPFLINDGASGKGATGTPPDTVTLEKTFKAKTIWADITVNLTAYRTHLKAVVRSDTPIQGWLIKRGSTKQVIAKGGVNESQTFTIDLNEPYDPDLELTCMVFKEGFTNPALIPLR